MIKRLTVNAGRLTHQFSSRYRELTGRIEIAYLLTISLFVGLFLPDLMSDPEIQAATRATLKDNVYGHFTQGAAFLLALALLSTVLAVVFWVAESPDPEVKTGPSWLERKIPFLADVISAIAEIWGWAYAAGNWTFVRATRAIYIILLSLFLACVLPDALINPAFQEAALAASKSIVMRLNFGGPVLVQILGVSVSLALGWHFYAFLGLILNEAIFGKKAEPAGEAGSE